MAAPSPVNSPTLVWPSITPDKVKLGDVGLQPAFRTALSGLAGCLFLGSERETWTLPIGRLVLWVQRPTRRNRWQPSVRANFGGVQRRPTMGSDQPQAEMKSGLVRGVDGILARP
jgi:hypothetical protein